MNKKLLTLGVASAAFAAMPIAGAFAADDDVSEVTDTITLTVESSCTLGTEASSGATPSGQLNAKGKIENLAGSTFKIVCNDKNGWELKAQGAGEDSGHETDLYNKTAQHAIATGTTIDDAHSNWGFKLDGGGVVSGYEAWAAVPASATVVAEQEAAAAEDEITVTYGASNNGDAPDGTYTGKVKYTLAAKAGA